MRAAGRRSPLLRQPGPQQYCCAQCGCIAPWGQTWDWWTPGKPTKLTITKDPQAWDGSGVILSFGPDHWLAACSPACKLALIQSGKATERGWQRPKNKITTANELRRVRDNERFFDKQCTAADRAVLDNLADIHGGLVAETIREGLRRSRRARQDGRDAADRDDPPIREKRPHPSA